SLRWSPDGRWLSFLATLSPEEPRGAPQLFVAQPSPGTAAQPRRLTEPERFPDGIDLYDWLPDGSGLVVEAADPPPRVAAADPRKRQDLYGDVRRLPAPQPSPSLSRIALAGGQVERLGAAPFAEPGALAVSPDGRWLAIAGSGLSETVETTEVA